MPRLRFSNVSFIHETAVEPLFNELNLHFQRGWTGVVGANGAGKTTFLELATGGLATGSGKITGRDGAIYCDQRTDHQPKGFGQFLESGEGARLRGLLGVDASWRDRWSSLSHGERKRAQIGTALWQDPHVLAIDEPTNHIDGNARKQLVDALAGFRGVGLLVSHDRALLDLLCQQCLFIGHSEVMLRPGGYSHGRDQSQMERESRERHYLSVQRERVHMDREVGRRRALAQNTKKRLSKKDISRKDHDAKSKVDAARLSGKDARAGRLQKQLESRLDRLRDTEAGLRGEKTRQLGIWMPGCKTHVRHLLHLKEGTVSLGDRRKLTWPVLSMKPADRIGFTGPNGFGKSTFITHLLRQLKLSGEKLLYLPQELSSEAGTELLEEARAMDGPLLGRVMAVISRLGSDPTRLLRSSRPSPGETRKLMLALGVCREPHLIVMDEPTNHLDLPSVECLEKALEDCPCGLILISHDEPFLKGLTTIRWSLQTVNEGNVQLRVKS